MRPDPRALGVYLWRSAMTEGIAASVFAKVARAEWATTEDRRTASTFSEQEHEHSELLRALAKEYVSTRPDEALRQLYVPAEPDVAIVGVNQAERMSLKGFAHMIDLGIRLKHGAMISAYARIAEEEITHLAWSTRLLPLLRQDPDRRARIRAYLRQHPIAVEYRRVAQERPWQVPS